MGPRGIPPDTLTRLNVGIVKAMNSPEVRRRLAGAQIIGSTPETFAAHLQRERVKWADAVKRSGAKPE